jgi:glycosyltransferase involved in cell wall biosynthesis
MLPTGKLPEIPPELPEMKAPAPLTIAHVSAERGFSGGEVQVFLLMEGLRQRGHRNVLLCPTASLAALEAHRRGLETAAIRPRGHWWPGGVTSIAQRLREVAPDLVHLHTGRATWLGSLAARRLGLPAVATRRMDRPVRRGWRTRLVYGRAVDRTVAISDAVARRLEAGGVPSDRIRVIRSAVDPERLRPGTPREVVRESLGAEPDEPCLLVAAALVQRKGVDVAIDALALLAREELAPPLWVAGAGPQQAALERRARRRGVAGQVRFLGRRDEVADLLGACDVFVLPSRHEGLGVAALEAMALGCPVVASRVGGLAEAVVHERTGLLVRPGDASALAEALARILGDAALRARLGAAGPALVAERHSAEALVDAYQALYLEVLGAAARPGGRP